MLLVIAFLLWQPSGVTIYRLEGVPYYLAIGGMGLALFGFFYCFKYTTSFAQWIGVAQVHAMITKKEPSKYYRVRKNGPKKYVRFPHHTCLALLFWSQPVMTLDTLWLAIFATAYTYVGTMHQDSRGRRLLGEEWIEYSKTTNLMFPNPVRILRDVFAPIAQRRAGDRQRVDGRVSGAGPASAHCCGAGPVSVPAPPWPGTASRATILARTVPEPKSA